MILIENHHINSEKNMVSDGVQMNCQTNGEAEKLHKQRCRRGRQGEAGSSGIRAERIYDDEDAKEISGINSGDAVGCSNWNFSPQKNGKRQSDMSLEDMYNKQYDYDEDEDDSDWEPLQKHIEIIKWFCANCTMANIDGVVHCDVCGEHRESGILRHGFFSSSISPEEDATQNGSEIIIAKCKDSVLSSVASKKSTVVGFDERMLLHAEIGMKSHPHPERPDRLRAIAASFATAGIFPGRCNPISAREITREELQRIHSVENIEAVENTSSMLTSYFTPDTYANEHSALAARLAAGLCADLASTVISGRARNGFALVRPPGHHAGVKEAMGFCLHNNAAIAASAALVAGAKKILIIDWDVHHGNGTQEIFDRSKSVLYISLHRHEGGKFYPGTGAADEVGTMGAEGYCVNIPWRRGGIGDNDYIYAFQNVVLPIASEFNPDFTIISAGFDAARGDPLGCCNVTPAGYAQMTKMLSALSDGKLLVILEGGYNLRSISSSATAVIKVLLGEDPGCNVDKIVPSKSGLRTIFEVLKIQTKFWHSLEDIFSKFQSQWGLLVHHDAGPMSKGEFRSQRAGKYNIRQRHLNSLKKYPPKPVGYKAKNVEKKSDAPPPARTTRSRHQESRSPGQSDSHTSSRSSPSTRGNRGEKRPWEEEKELRHRKSHRGGSRSSSSPPREVVSVRDSPREDTLSSSPSMPFHSVEVPSPPQYTSTSAHAPRLSAEEKGKSVETRPLSWLQSDFQLPNSDSGFVALREEIMKATPPLNTLDFCNKVVASHLGVVALKRGANAITYEDAHKFSINEVVNRIGGLLSQLGACILDLGEKASSLDQERRRAEENLSRYMTAESKLRALQMEFDSQSVNLKSLERVRDKLGDEVDDLKVKLSQSDQRLQSSEDRSLTLEKELAEMKTQSELLREHVLRANSGRDETVARLVALQEEAEYLKSDRYQDKIISDFKSSAAYRYELNEKKIEFLEKGAIHMIRQLHHKFEDKEFVMRCFYNDFYADECRKGADFVPFKEDDLEAIKVRDSSRSMPEWVPPPSLHPCFWDFLNAIPTTPSTVVEEEEEEDAIEADSVDCLLLI